MTAHDGISGENPHNFQKGLRADKRILRNEEKKKKKKVGRGKTLIGYINAHTSERFFYPLHRHGFTVRER